MMKDHVQFLEAAKMRRKPFKGRTPIQKANLIHMGDTFFNGFYPVIDAGTGGTIDGMIAAADKVLPLADNNTKVFPGHGPLGNKIDLTKFRDMLIEARDRVLKLKTEGKSVGEIAASKPFADLEASMGQGLFYGRCFCADGVFDPLSRDTQRCKGAVVLRYAPVADQVTLL